MRALVYASRELLVFGMAKNPKLLAPMRRLAIAHMHRQVKDRALRKKLTPRYSPGCKRLLLSDHYYRALDKPNTDLVTEGIRAINQHAIVTNDGAEHPVDVIVFATGFRVTDNPMLDKVFGRGGITLHEKWTERGMRAYLGTVVDDFPNLFLLSGPNTGIGHTSLLVMIEAQVGYVVKALRTVGDRPAKIEVRQPVLDAFNDELQDKMERTVWTQGGCASWYLDDKGRNSTLWPDFTWRYKLALRRFEPSDYVIERVA
jgi:cation diffusion facilitator CzcD-associated flavoprotein CzcO